MRRRTKPRIWFLLFPELRRGFSAPHKVHHFYAHHDFAILIQHFDKREDNTAVRLGFGAATLQNCYSTGQFIPWEDGLIPFELIAARRTEIGYPG